MDVCVQICFGTSDYCNCTQAQVYVESDCILHVKLLETTPFIIVIKMFTVQIVCFPFDWFYLQFSNNLFVFAKLWSGANDILSGSLLFALAHDQSQSVFPQAVAKQVAMKRRILDKKDKKDPRQRWSLKVFGINQYAECLYDCVSKLSVPSKSFVFMIVLLGRFKRSLFKTLSHLNLNMFVVSEL